MADLVDLGDILEEAVHMIINEDTNVDRVVEVGDSIAEVGSLQHKISFITKSEHVQFGSDRLTDSFKEDLQRVGPFLLIQSIYEQQNENFPTGPALSLLEFRQLARQMENSMGHLQELVRRAGFTGPAIPLGHQDRAVMEEIGWDDIFPPILFHTRLADFSDITSLVDQGEAWVNSLWKNLIRMSQSMTTTSCLLYTSPSPRDS